MATNISRGHIVISMDGKHAQNVMNALKKQAEETAAAMKRMEASGEDQTNVKEYRALVSELKSVERAIRENEKMMIDLDQVIQNLATTSKKELAAALKSAMREMADTSEASGNLNKLREQYNQIMGQLKKLGVEYVNVEQVMNNLDKASDKALRAALAQMRELREETERGTAAYSDYDSKVQRLEAAISGRGKMSVAEANGIASGSMDASVEQTREAIRVLKEFRDTLKISDVSGIQSVDAAIQKLNDRLSFTEREVVDVAAVLADPKSFSPDQIRKAIAELNAQLSRMSMNDVGRGQLRQQVKLLSEALDETGDAGVDVEHVLRNIKSAPIETLRRAAHQLSAQMETLERNTDEYVRASAAYSEIRRQIDAVNGSWREQENVVMKVLKRLTAYVGIYGVYNLVTNKLSDMISRNTEFSDSLSDIRKTTGLSAEEVEKLSLAVNSIDTRTSVQEMHNLAYEAGRLGIGKYGADGVLGFVRAANQLSVALKEDLGDDAIVELSKIAEVMGIIPKLGVEKALISIGSGINTLSQSSTAKGAYIADYTGRLAGLATQAHLTVDEVMAFAAASDATKQEVEVSATAMGKFITQLQTHYRTVASAVGVSEESLHSMLEQGRTADAVVMVLEKLNQKGGLSVMAPLMKDLGSDGARLTASLANLASNVGLVKDMLDTSRKSFSQATSVTAEYNIKNENAAAIIERMKNSWEKLFVNAGNVGVLRDVSEELAEMSTKLQTNEQLIFLVKTAFSGLIVAIKTLVALAPGLAAFFLTKGISSLGVMLWQNVIPAVKATYTSLMSMIRAMILSRGAAVGAAAAFRGMSAAMATNVLGIVVAGITTLVFALRSLKSEASAAEKSAERLNSSWKNFSKTSSASVIEVNQLFSRLKNATKGTKEHSDAMTLINKLYGKYLPFLITEKTSLEEIEKAQIRVNTQLRKSIAYKARNAAIEAEGTEYTNKMSDSLSNIQETYNRAGLRHLGETDVNYIVEASDRYFKAGKTYKEIVEGVWNDLYRKGGRSFNLVARGGALSNDWSALKSDMSQYIANMWNQSVAINKIRKKYDALVGDYNENEGNGAPYTIVEPEDTGGGGKSGNRDILKKYRSYYQAVMAAIEVYYKQQEQVVRQAYLDQKITMERMEQELDAISFRHLNTRIEARRKLHGDKDNRWAENLIGLGDDDIARTEGSMQAIRNLAEKDLDEIGRVLRQFGEKEDDEIWAKMEEDILKKQDIAIGHRKEIEKVLLEYDFTGKVTRQYQTQLEKLGLFFTNYTDEVRNGYANAQEAAAAGMAQLRAMGGNLYDIDINTDAGLQQFKNFLLEGEAFGAEMLNMAADDYRTLYYKTMEYVDALTEAEKRARERQLKIASERYKHTDAYKNNRTREASNRQMDGIYGAASSLGLASDQMVQDQEVKMYQNRLEAAMEYYNYLKEKGYDTEEQYIKVQEAAAELSSKLVEQVKLKLDGLKNYTDAIATFGEDFGAAVFSPLEERHKALETLLRSFGEATNKIILDWVKQKIEHEVLRHAMLKTEERYQNSMVEAKSGEGSSEERMDKTMARAAQKRARSSIKELLSIKKRGAKEEEKVDEEKQSAQEVLATEGSEAISKAMVGLGAKVTQAKKAQASEQVQTQAAQTSAETTMGIASGAAKTIGELGWWGIPLVAVITALLNGLLSAAMSKVSGLFGGGESGGAVASQAKLVTGMLTYDAGNVQRFSGVIDGKSYPYLGSDGRVYQATQASELRTGLVANPVATLVDGRPSLIAERGPEIIIGRETTAAMMMSRPDLLSEIVRFDRNRSGRNYRAYDAGNVQDKARAMGFFADGLGDSSLQDVLSELSLGLREMREVNAVLATRLSKGIQAVIQKNGKGGLVDEVIDGLSFASKNNTSEKLRRLLGR